MKKLIFALLIGLVCVSSISYAEQSAQTYSGNATQNYREQQVFIDAYNSSGSDISSNQVVVIDTSNADTASGANLGTYFTTTTTANNPLVLGVTDAVIKSGTVGRICVRGPHKCYLVSSGLQGATAGATLATTTTTGAAAMSNSTTKGGNFAVLLSATSIQNATSPVASYGPPDSTHTGDGYGGLSAEPTTNYWIWIATPGTD